MAFQQTFDASDTHFGSEGDLSLNQKLNSVSPTVTNTENLPGCFECNICFDSCHEPVVTLCGHLYCWPCIYKWLQVQTPALEAVEQQKCPVCKAYISSSALVPLYGRGSSSSNPEPRKPQIDTVIPNRPPALGTNALVPASTSMIPDSNQQQHPQHEAFHHQQYFPHPIGNYTSMTPTLGGTIATGFSSPTVNMVGELVFATMFRASDPSLFAYPHSNSYYLHGNSSPRLRSQEMQLDRSLNRVTIFLFCCFALCLILF
ncbi:RING membrane-anchor 3 [Dorcoceras hygrometricum]|uniref:E3 ubiquitin-protein ligase RMA n=1 Tax=Dorcoceras hygrometricum TaxID=472368 RepID=A0A2Z7AZ96_9LAMI|nr:RING membrane-anchor 3 [Dorcoceras hygrometricum]